MFQQIDQLPDEQNRMGDLILVVHQLECSPGTPWSKMILEPWKEHCMPALQRTPLLLLGQCRS
jgi:hypothetical protein